MKTAATGLDARAAAGPRLRRELSPTVLFEAGPEACFPSLEAAYGALGAMARAEPWRWAAWKLGGTNHGSRAAFAVSAGYFGPIDARELRIPSLAVPRGESVPESVPAPLRPLAELKGEVELALRIGPDGHHPDAWAVALEMPASPIRNLPGAGVAALVADRCAAGELLLGPARAIDAGNPLPSFAGARFTQECDGTEVASGTVAGDLVAPPAMLLAEFLDLAAHHDMPVAPGHWVATGGITPCIPYVPGQRIRVLLDGIAELDLRIGNGR